MHVRATPLLLALTVLSTVLASTPLAAPAAAADTGPVPFGLTSLSDVMLDEAGGQLFLSPGRGGSGVKVTDLSGGNVRTIDGLPGASGMALTPDGRSLWVAVPTAGLARIDTRTLAVAQRIPLPTGVCPGDVEVVESRLVYGYSCNTYAGSGGYGGIGVVDAVSGAPYGTLTSGPFYRPVVARGPAGHVYAADAGLSPTGLHLFDVTQEAPVTVASRASICSNLRDLSAAPDGSRVVTSCGGTYEHRVYSADKLTLSGSYPTGSYPLAGAWSADGTTFAAGIDSAYEPDVYVYRQGWNAPARIVDFGSTQALLEPRGLAVSANGSRVWAVTGTTSTDLALHVLDVPGADTGLLTLSATPREFYPGSTTTLSGRLGTVAGASLAGESVRVSRAATGEAPVALPDVTTGADGTFSFSDTPPGSGTYVYSVFRDADAARAETSVLVWRTEGTLLLDLTRGTSGGTPVYGTVRLYYDGSDSAAGLSATVTRQAGGLSTHFATLSLDANGGAKFTDSPPAGDVAYTVTVGANGIHPAVTTTRTTTVLTATTLTASAPSSAVAGAPLPVQGTLLHAAGPVRGAGVVVSRGGCGVDWRGSAVTADDGTWAVTDDAPLAGSCRYSASYAGGDGYASSSAPAVTTAVTARPTTLTAGTSSPAVAGTTLTVSGRLTSESAAVAGAGILVARSGCTTVGWKGQASTTADGWWSVADPAPPGGTCTYRASFVSDGIHAPADTSTSASVAFRTTSLSLSVVRGTGSAKKLVYVTGQLGTTSTNRRLTITAQPAGGTVTELASSALVDSTGKLTVTYTPKTTTTYRVSFAGDAWYAPAAAEKVL